MSDSSCSSFSESILKLRSLREKLCESQKTWKEAFEIRDYVLKELGELRCMLKDENYTKEDCSKKVSSILNVFSLGEECSGENDA